jgi:hypothetical protein
VLRVPIGTAASRLRRARDRFRELSVELFPTERGMP